MNLVRNTLRAIALVASAGVYQACISPVDQDGSTVPGQCTQEAPLIEPAKTDILFVIDNSRSMAEEQEAVAVELPEFVAELKRGAGQSHDFQVGVVTTSVYQKARYENGDETYNEYDNQAGRLRSVPATEDGSDSGGERILKSEQPGMVDKFRRLVRQGTNGSGQETPFEAVRLAVATELVAQPLETGGNEGFLRDGARLLVVVVSDEDDCSESVRPPQVHVGTDEAVDYCGDQSEDLLPVETYADIFKNLRHSDGSLREVLWAAIAPVSQADKTAQGEVVEGKLRNVDCPTSVQPGHRQRAMAELFDQSLANLASICQPTYRETLLDIARAATVRQSIEVRNVPDPRLLKVELTRANGTVQACTVANGGIRWEPGQVLFDAGCVRRYDDTAVNLEMLCAG